MTGATGVVGRRAVPLLLAAGHRVSIAARSPEKSAAFARIGASPVAVDLLSRDAVRSALRGQEVVVNLATHMPASTARMLLPGAWRENDRIRREGSAILSAEAAAAGATRFVQESFAPIYEDSGDRWIDESFPLRPVRYNRTILDAERSAAQFAAAGGQGVVLRFAAFYGPDSRFGADIVASVRHGRVPIPGSPDAYFSAVTHDDAATAVVAALGLPSGAYNVVDDEPLTRREHFGALAAALGVGPPKFPPAWAARLMGSLGELMTRSLRISNRKLRSQSAWEPRFASAREGWPAVIAEMPAEKSHAVA